MLNLVLDVQRTITFDQFGTISMGQKINISNNNGLGVTMVCTGSPHFPYLSLFMWDGSQEPSQLSHFTAYEYTIYTNSVVQNYNLLLPDKDEILIRSM